MSLEFQETEFVLMIIFIQHKQRATAIQLRLSLARKREATYVYCTVRTAKKISTPPGSFEPLVEPSS